MSIFHLSPAKCCVCRFRASDEKLPLCNKCLHVIQEMLTQKCPQCGQIPPNCKCTDDVRSLLFFRQYESQRLLYTLKYHADRRVIEFITKTAVEACGINTEKFDGVTYVPRLARRRRRYGFDQSFEIARAISGLYGLPLVHSLKRKGGAEQKLLSRKQRIENVKMLFQPRFIPSEKYKHLLLIDDICTTGATVTACKEILCQQIAKSVSVMTIAKTVLEKPH